MIYAGSPKVCILMDGCSEGGTKVDRTSGLDP